jgi:hypothetical protein
MKKPGFVNIERTIIVTNLCNEKTGQVNLAPRIKGRPARTGFSDLNPWR